MPSVDLTPYNQPQGTTSDGTKFDNLLAYLQSILNALDNGNISPTAAITYSRLALAGKINLSSDVDTATSLAIARLAGYPSDGSKALMGDGTWGTVGSANVGTELDYKQLAADVTGIVATTEGTAVTLITGTSQAYDATKKNIEVYWPQLLRTAGTPTVVTFVVLRGSTVLGQHSATVGATGTPDWGGTFTIQDTPSAATFSYVVKAFVDAGTVTVKTGAGGSGNLFPAHLRVTKA